MQRSKQDLLDSIRQLKSLGAFETPPRMPKEYVDAREHYLKIVRALAPASRNPFADELLYELPLEILIDRMLAYLEQNMPGKDWKAELAKSYAVEHKSHQDILAAFIEQTSAGRISLRYAPTSVSVRWCAR